MDSKVSDTLEKIDGLRLENAALRVNYAQAQLALAQKNQEALIAELREKYHLGVDDRVDSQNLAIIRTEAGAKNP